ncbi:MAG: hypothetical protein ACYTBJ_17380 [Planctomycetota bacterium]
MDPKFKPDKGFFKTLMNEYSRRTYGSTGFRIEDHIRSDLLAAAYGLTAWLKSKKGAGWCFSIVGVEEIRTHVGFNYFFVDTGDNRRKVLARKVRIFRKIIQETPDLPREGLDIAKRVVYTEGWKLPNDTIFGTTFRAYRSWLKTGSGYDWLSSIFDAVKHISIFGDLAYKVLGDSGEPYWFDSKQIVSSPKPLEVCMNCEIEHPCVDNYSGLGKLCIRCYSEGFAESEMLNCCNRHECQEYRCSHFIGDEKYDSMCEDMNRYPVKFTGTING